MDPLSLLGRAVAVFLLLGVTLWLVRRTDGLKKLRRSETPLEVLGSARLGKGASVALVRIGDADYALGVTDQAVSLLTEAELGEEPEPIDDGVEPKARSGFPAALQAQLGLLTRKGHGSRAEQALAAPAAPATAATAADSDFEQLLAAATVPVETPDDVADQVAGDGDAPLSSRLKEILTAAEAAPDASTDSAPVPVPVRERPGRSTGARGARGPRARAAADAGTASAAAAARTGQRRSGRTRTGTDSAAA